VLTGTCSKIDRWREMRLVMAEIARKMRVGATEAARAINRKAMEIKQARRTSSVLQARHGFRNFLAITAGKDDKNLLKELSWTRRGCR
jgi:hypothetical protein